MSQRRSLTNFFISLKERSVQKLNSAAGAPMDPKIKLPDMRLQGLLVDSAPRIWEETASPVGRRLKTRWLLPASGHAAARIDDSFLAAMYWMDGTPDLAMSLLAPFLDAQGMDGRIPAEVGPLRAGFCPAPPVIFWALNRWFERTGDKAALTEPLQKAIRFADWMSISNKTAGGLFAHREAAFERHDAFLDHADREFAQGRLHGDDEGRPYFAALNFQAAAQMAFAARLAHALNDEKMRRKFETRGEKFSALAREKFWNEEAGFFTNRAGESLQPRATSGGWLALLGEVALREQAERMVERLAEIRMDALESPLPALCQIEGLRRYGFGAEMAELIRSHLLKAASAEEMRPGTLKLKRGAHFLCLFLLRDYLFGYRKHFDRIILAPNIPKSWEGGEMALADPENGLKIILALKEEGRIVAHLDGPGVVAPTLEIANGGFATIVPPAPKKEAESVD